MENEISKKVIDNLDKLAPEVYKDSLKGSAKAIGNTIEQIVKTSLRPANGILWTINQACDWVENRVIMFYNKHSVKPEAIKQVNVEVAAKVIHGLQFVGTNDDHMLRNYFASLLAKSMVEENSHSSLFAEFLKQITVDEARIISVLSSGPSPWIISGIIQCKWEPIIKEQNRGYTNVQCDIDTSSNSIKERYDPFINNVKLRHPEELMYYLTNLKRLSLIETIEIYGYEKVLKFFQQHKVSKANGILEGLNQVEKIRELKPKFIQTVPDVGPICGFCEKNVSLEIVKLTDWGWKFSNACSSSEFYNQYSNSFINPDWTE